MAPRAWEFWKREWWAARAAAAPVPVATTPSPADAPGATPTPATASPSFLRWPRSVGSSSQVSVLTPERLATLLRQAENGQPRGQAELFTEMFDRDLRLVGLANTRQLAVADLPWTVQPAGVKRRDKMIAGYCTEVLKGIPNWMAATAALAGGVFYGYAASEIDWRQEGQDVWVEALLARPQTWFLPDAVQADRWRILSQAEPAVGEPLQPGAWIWHEGWAKPGQTAASTALARVLARAFVVRNMGLRDWLIFAEVYGQPVRVARYRDGTSEEDLKVVLQALKQLGRDAAAMLPEGVSLDFIEAERGSSVDVYRALLQWAAQEMAIAVLGQTLTSDAGDKGTQALGTVHENVRQDLIKYDAGQLSGTISRDLVRWIVDFKFGPQTDYPRLVYRVRTQGELEGAAKLYTELSKLGTRFPAEHIHSTFGIPQPAADEATYGAGAGAGTGATQPAKATGRVIYAGGGRSWWYACSADHASHELLDQLELAITQALKDGGDEAWADVIKQLQRVLGEADDLDQMEDQLVEALKALNLDQFTDVLTQAVLTGDLVGRAQVRGGEKPVDEWPAVPPTEAVTWWREKTRLSATDFEQVASGHRTKSLLIAKYAALSTVTAIHQALGDSLEAGETVDQFEDRMNAALAAEGLDPEEPHRVHNIFRTNTSRAYGVARYNEQRDPDIVSERPYWLYDGTDDKRTRPTHRALFGKVFPADHAIWQVIYPPNGFQCRCYVRSLTKADLKQLGLEVSTEFPTLRRMLPDGTLGPQEVALPDEGFQRNPALEDVQLDWSQFPAQWRKALGISEGS